jgi:hypothetical protein
MTFCCPHKNGDPNNIQEANAFAKNPSSPRLLGAGKWPSFKKFKKSLEQNIMNSWQKNYETKRIAFSIYDFSRAGIGSDLWGTRVLYRAA